ncbi:MAG: DUF3131 domain-containing protein, partial [Clostridiales bacterium]|nr:DUF3131 domain-containing protein [Clostridiales bacterium]
MTLFLMFLGTLLKKLIRRNIFGDFSYSCDDAEFEKQIRKFAKNTGLPDRNGKGVSASNFIPTINKLSKIVSLRSRDGELYEFEKWFYENTYLLTATANSKAFSEFYNLPHIKGTPRIVALAREVLRLSGYKLDVQRAERVVEIMNEYAPLTFEEVLNLGEAFNYALLEKAVALMDKAFCIYKLQKLSEKGGKKLKKYLSSKFMRLFIGKKLKLETADEVKFATAAIIVEMSSAAKNVCTSVSQARLIDPFKNYAPLRTLKNVYEFNCMAQQTQFVYLAEIAKQSAKININENIYAQKLVEYASYLGFRLHEVLFYNVKALNDYCLTGGTKRKVKKKHKTKTAAEYAYFTALWIVVIGLQALFGYITYSNFSNYLTVLSYLPSVNITNKIYQFALENSFVCSIVMASVMSLTSFFALPRVVSSLFITVIRYFTSLRPTYRMNYAILPDDGRTLVAYTQYITSKEQLLNAIENIKSLSALYNDKNLTFVMLADFKPSDEETVPEDDEFLEILRQSGINFMVRKRVKKGDRYSARERKRGAIEDMNRALMTGDFSKFTVNRAFLRPVYVVLLDDDSKLLPGAIRQAVCEMMHPMNARYDLMAFECRTNLFSLTTKYSMRHAENGGFELYPCYSDFYFNLFSKSVFCGKGIYRLESFYRKLNGALPEGRVLSHDALEGAALSTGKLSGIVFEDAPNTFAAEIERNLRWQRGDVQNLPFISSKFIKPSPLYGTLMFMNGFESFRLMSFTLLFLFSAISLNPYVFAFTAALFFVERILGFFSGLFSFASLSPKHALIKTLKALEGMIMDFALLTFNALNSIKVFFTAVFRMISGKRLLEWKTFFQSRAGKTDAVKLIAPNTVFLTLVSLLAFFSSYIFFFGTLFYFASFLIIVARLVREGMPEKEKIKEEEKQTLLEYAESTYKYFLENSENELIADNYQVFGNVGRAEHTSPTNIGYSILSHVSAALLNITDKETAEERIEKIVSRIEGLEKWKGHLLNWYNINTGKPLEPLFVSSVDSGNLAACLIVAKEFVSSYELKERINKIIEDIDFKALFDFKKKQFYIGYNLSGQRSEGHYDLMASESRLAALVAISRGVTPVMWRSLSRRHATGGTLYSWNGTMFEYLMSEIFINSPPKSMLRASAKGAVKAQIRSRCQGFFGISECGCYRFDSESRYQYYAFGVSSLALRSEHSECVISPYSTFLALDYDFKACYRNLKALKENGYYGKYGFYEAIDFLRGGTVESFMAHHQGMSLAAIANTLTNGKIRELFGNDDKIRATKLLLNESEIKTKGEKKPQEKALVGAKKTEDYFTLHTPQAEPKFNLHYGAYTVITDELGQSVSDYGGIKLGRIKNSPKDPFGPFLYIKNERGETYSPTFSPLKILSDEHTAMFSRNMSVYENKTHGAKMTLVTTPIFSGEVRRFEIREFGKHKIAFFSDLCLNYADVDAAHSTFSSMMIETSCDLSKGVIYAKRRGGNENDCMCSAMCVKGIKFRPVTSKHDFFGGETPASLNEFN